jgi:hypothetical protein
VTVNLADNDNIDCTFTNTAEGGEEGGSLTITKVWSGGTAGTATFTTSESLGVTGNSFSLDGTTTVEDFTGLADDGVYTVTEDALPGWTLSVVCSGETTSTVDTTVLRGVTVTLDAEDDIDCTFTNTADTTTPAGEGSLTIMKVWQDPAGATVTGVPTAFTTSDSLNDPDDTFSLTEGSASILFMNLGDGTYVLTETAQSGWVVFSITCTGQTTSQVNGDLPSGVLTVNLADDEDLTCTYINRSVTAINPSFPDTPGVESPTTPNVNNPTTPGVVSPTTPNVNNPTTPGVVSPTTPGEFPSSNIPPTSQLPGVVSSESPSSNIGGFQQSPLPPSAGNTGSEGNANASVAIASGLAVVLGLSAAATYGLRRR